MKRFWKILKIASLVVVGLVVVIALVIGGTLYSIIQSSPINPSEYAWEKNISEAQVDDLAGELLSKMTLEEKIDQMSGEGVSRMLVGFFVKGHALPVYSGENTRLGIPPIAFTDGPRGVISGPATSFPVSIARAATWNLDLEKRVGDVMGKETRAVGANYFGGVCINLVRHPSMGRAQESYGEDPWLMGEMAVGLLKSVQQHNVMACAKHYALNSMETARFGVNVELDERTLREVYLPHYQKAVENGVASIMSAYNKFRGEHCGHSHYLLTKILREDWGFKGFVTSDWMYGLRDGEKGVKAGLDIEMPGAVHYGDNLLSLVEAGKVTEEEIDAIVLRILRTKLYYITRTDPMEYNEELAAHPDHTALARQVAEEGTVLLKNEGDLLPLDKNAVRKIAVVGYLSDQDNTGDHGSSGVVPPYYTSPLKGIQDYLGTGATVLHADGSDLAAVESVSREADVVLVIAGVHHSEEGEFITGENPGGVPKGPEEKKPLVIGSLVLSGGDRVPLSLKKRDLDVIKAASAANPNCVVTLIGGSSITMEEWKNDVPAILMAWYYGMEGGNALARILFGDVNPSGKLPLTFPTDESQLPPFDEFATEVEYGYYHGYTLADKQGYEPAFPFGYGLSYTSFSYSNLALQENSISKDGILQATVDVTNTGTRAGSEVVQLYVGFEHSAVDRPVKLLRGFAKVHLEPGQTKTVPLSVAAKDLAWYNPETSSWEVEPVEHSVLVGPSSDAATLLRTTFEVTG